MNIFSFEELFQLVVRIKDEFGFIIPVYPHLLMGPTEISLLNTPDILQEPIKDRIKNYIQAIDKKSEFEFFLGFLKNLNQSIANKDNTIEGVKKFLDHQDVIRGTEYKKSLKILSNYL